MDTCVYIVRISYAWLISLPALRLCGLIDALLLSFSLHIFLSLTLSPCFPPSLSFVSPLHRFEVPCYVVLVLVCNVFRIRFPFFLIHSLQDINRNTARVARVFCLLSSVLCCPGCPGCPRWEFPFPHFPFGNSCQSHWINYDNSNNNNNNYSACCHDGLSIRFGMQWVSAKPLSHIRSPLCKQTADLNWHRAR